MIYEKKKYIYEIYRKKCYINMFNIYNFKLMEYTFELYINKINDNLFKFLVLL